MSNSVNAAFPTWYETKAIVLSSKKKKLSPRRRAIHNTFPLIGYLLLRMSMRKSSKGKSITRGWRQRAADHGIKTVDAGGERPDIVWGQHKREVKTTIVILGRREVLVKPERFFALPLVGRRDFTLR